MKKLILALIFTFLPLGSILAQSSGPNNTPSSTEPSLVSSETGVDYTSLRDLLKDKQWRRANEKTNALLLKASGREKQGWMPTESIQQLPCSDMQIIDNLWRQYSNNRFGFSIQFAIFVETGNKPGKLVAVESYQTFGDRIGWRKGDDWITFKENLNFSSDAPVGHLPAPRDEYQFTGGRLQYTTLTQRMISCQLVTYTPPSPIQTP